MTRASFECPVTREQCSAPECKRSFCVEQWRIATREQGEEQMWEKGQRQQRLSEKLRKGDTYGLLDELGLPRPRIKRRI
jgi:hypothetical protein